MSRTTLPPTAFAAPLAEYHTTAAADPNKVHTGLDGVADQLAGRLRSAGLGRSGLLGRARALLVRAPSGRDAMPDRLGPALAKAASRVRRCGRHRPPADLTDHALALIAAAARTTTHLRPHPEQVAAALAISEGTIVEMATGEGKTLAVAIAAAFEAWRGRPVHVVTANDYLVARDRDWLAPHYEMCGLTAGAITSGMSPDARRAAYGADITYATSKELVADFLRDRLLLGELVHPGRRLVRGLLRGTGATVGGTVMRGLFTAIIDEADHVLVDEAVTPLIISRPTRNDGLAAACKTARNLAARLEPGRHYHVGKVRKDIDLTPSGTAALDDDAARLDLQGVWRNPGRREELVATALRAQHFYRRGEQYLVTDDGKVAIVDEFTGRVMHQRTWQQGLHQAVEVQEGLEPTVPNETLARLSFQRFFRLYRKIAGLTGTAREASPELWAVYRLPFVGLPTHAPCIRQHLRPRVFATAAAKWQAVVAEIAAVHRTRRPVLAGTRSVAASELLAGHLTAGGIPHVVLNARNDRGEADIVAEAGREGRVTIATNMAGRGTDIRISESVVALGGLHVVATEPHASARVDRQLFGRAGRQGEPGSARLFASLEDEVVTRFAPAPVRAGARAALAARLPGSAATAYAAVRLAQRLSEGFAYRQRRGVLRQDDWLEESLGFSRTNS